MSSCKILTIQLPSPPSSLYQNLPPNEENAESSIGINVHIQWKVKSGSIVHKGETIASLSYILAGDTPSESNGGADDEQIIDGGGDKNSRGDAPRTGSSGAAFESTNVAATEGTSLRSLIRARMKRRWAGGVNPSTTLSLSSTGKGDEKRGNSNGGRVIGGEIDGSSKNRNKNYAASIQIRSPSNGFLRVQQTNTMIPNAFPLKCGNNRNNNTKEEKDKMILAIVEPCRHPAVVGDLCAVCGYDFKSSGHEKDVIDVDADYTNSDTNGVGENKSVDDRLLIDLSSDDDIDDDDEEESMRRRNNHSKQSSSGKRHFDSSDIIDLTEVENNDATSTADAVKDATTNSKLTSTHATTISASAATDTATSSAIESTTQTKAESNSSVSASNALGSGAVAPKLSGSTNLGPPAKATNMRSLSSLLSGVESTRQMQQTRHSRPRPASTMTKIGRGHNIISPSPQLMSSNSNPNSNSTSATNPSTSIPKMTQMTVSGGITVTISESEAKSISEASSKKLRESKQLCLVMDLDHTLLHATDDYRAGRFAAEEILLRENDAEAGTTEDKIEGEDAKQKERQNRDREKRNNPKVVPNPEKRNDVRSILLPVDLPPPQYQQYLQQKQHQEYMLQSESKTYEFKLPPLPRTTTQQRTHENTPVNLRHYVKLRPHLKEFFEQIQSKYKLSVYTAGTRAYAEQIAIMICRHLVGTSYDEEGLQLLRAKMRELDQDCKKFREYKAKLGRRRQLETARQRGDFMETDLETIALEAERESMEEQGITEIDGNKGEEKKNEWNVKKAVTLPARKQKGKCVSFAVNLETETKESALRIRNNAPSEGAASDGVEAKPKRETKEAKGRIGENEPSHDENNDSDKAEVSSVNEGQPTIGASESNLGIDTVASSTASSSSSTSIKRNNSSRGAELSIPRKKKRPAPPSLLPLVPPPAKDGAASNKKQGVISSNSNEMDEVNMKDLSEERDKLRKKLDEAERLEIAAVDLRRKIFGSRIVSRTDVGDLGKDVKSLKRVFPCGGVMAAIIDDREDVWANANNNVTGRPGEPPDNLLLVKPYHWKPFSGYADVNNASGNDLSKKDVPASSSNDKQHDVEEDVQLLWTADVLKRLHERYFSSSKAQQESEQISVPSVLRSMRKEVLQRHPQAKIVFSGLIPISKQNIESPVRPHVVRYAEELGAEVLPDVTNQTTHIVAARDGSEKIQRARRDVPGCFIVHTSWLMECYWSLTRRDVINHHMGPMPKREHVKSNVKEHETTASRTKILIELDENESEKDENDDDDEEDDGFAADLESEMMKGDSSFLC